MTTKDKNKIIAQFMGLRPKLESPDVYSFSDSPWFVTRGNDPEKIMDDIANYAKYHSDWNWLMPVLIKMYQVERGRFIYELRDDRIEIWDWALREKEGAFNYYSIFEGRSQNYDIMGGIHEAVYQFVVWYNQQVKETVS